MADVLGTLNTNEAIDKKLVAKAADSTEQAIIKNSEYSVRQFSPTAWGGLIGDALGFMWPARSDLLPAWGTHACDVELRALDYTQHNAIWSGAKKIAKQKILGTPWEISGGRNLTMTWQDVFNEADFGEGYDFLMDKALDDYYVLNRGLFIEKVSYGESDTPINEGAKILGLNQLDGLRIYFTGNREFPYFYASEWDGRIHKIHYTRIIHLSDSPSPITRMMGMGRSALYDASTVANAQILLGRHQNELLDDMPPSGIVLFNNVRPDQVENAMKQFSMEMVTDGQNVYRAPIQLSSMDPNFPAEVKFIPLATVPEGFDFEKYYGVHVNIFALCLQIDPQDIWPLQSRVMGSGEQSLILQRKADSKGPNYLLTRLTRKFNTVMPRSMEWKYKASNTEGDAQIATTAKTWVDTANGATFLNNDEKRQLVANQSPAFADVLLDEQGQVRLYDADPKDPQQVIIATDSAEVDSTDPLQDTTATDTTKLNASSGKVPKSETALSVKNPVSIVDKQPQTNVSNGKPAMTVNNAVDNKLKEVQDQLKAGLLTIAQAQTALGLTPDPIYDGMYLVEGFPVPREKLRDLWQAHFGRGVASFDAVVSGETLPSGTGAGVVPGYASKDIIEFKDIDATMSAFIDEITAAMQDGADGSATKAATAARFRGAIIRYGKKAYEDGLEHGGVDPSELDEDDLRVIADDNVWDSVHVTDLMNELFSEAGISNIEYRASLWSSTINRFYYDGIASADKNGMYEFVGDDGVENCRTCKALKGQVHRMKDWKNKGLRPGLDHENFECGTWEPNCSHYLEKTTGKAIGGWL